MLSAVPSEDDCIYTESRRQGKCNDIEEDKIKRKYKRYKHSTEKIAAVGDIEHVAILESWKESLTRLEILLNYCYFVSRVLEDSHVGRSRLFL